jgi:hypothetical protein
MNAMETKKIGNVILSVNLNHTQDGYVLSIKECFNFDDVSLQHYYGEQFAIRLLIHRGSFRQKRLAGYAKLQAKLVAKINHDLTDYNNISGYIVNAFNVNLDTKIKRHGYG